MIRRLPLVPTVLVLIAVGVMIRLGFWQLDRLEQKEALLERYAAAASFSSEAPWPRDAEAAEASLYRRARIRCVDVTEPSWIAGRSAEGEAGLAHSVRCRMPDGDEALVVLGWSRAPTSPEWNGGEVMGIIAPGPRLVADPPLAGLEANASPDPSEIPNNHLSYAVQWFLFAGVALVIYALAVRKRLADARTRG
jgi:cytochrome oxidase assembly protein ShyY1